MDVHLEIWEVNLVLRALGTLPYDEVAATIAAIVQQVELHNSVKEESQ